MLSLPKHLYLNTTAVSKLVYVPRSDGSAVGPVVVGTMAARLA